MVTVGALALMGVLHSESSSAHATAEEDSEIPSLVDGGAIPIFHSLVERRIQGL